MDDLKMAFYSQLTWGDIQIWAGETITGRGRSYQRSGAVDDLSVTPDGGLLAWVEGTSRYATTVDVVNGALTSACTCPYGGTCKHAVAVVLEYLEQLKKKKPVQKTTQDDERISLLEDSLDPDLSAGLEDIEQPDSSRLEVKSGKAKEVSKLHSFLEQQKPQQLLALLETIANRYPEARQFLLDSSHLSSGETDKLVISTRREIERLCAEPAWSNHWNNEGYIPDYSGVKNRLEMLLSRGYADEVLNLGKMLLESGNRQLEESDDEGETEEEIRSCMEVVIRALTQSSLPPAGQILWMVEAELGDDFEITSDQESFWNQTYAAADWSIVADTLMKRLNNPDWPLDEHSEAGKDYYRDQVTDWIVLALENAGRSEEIIPLCQAEALKTDSYIRLVEQLIGEHRTAEAEEWINKGIAATKTTKTWIAASLRIKLRGLREKEGNWLSTAAFHANDFFIRPNPNTYDLLRQASEKAGVWPEVRKQVIHYLESGALPTVPSWPLPETGLKEAIETDDREFPLADTLIDIAIAEKQPAEVVRWYEFLMNQKSGQFRFPHYYREDEIAGSIAGAYPQKALAIWKKLAEEQIAQTQVNAYNQAAVYLAKMRPVLLSLGKEDRWKDYLTALRAANLRKKRLLQILDDLDGKPIVET